MDPSEEDPIADDELEAIELPDESDHELDALADAAESTTRPHVYATHADNPARDDDGRLDTDLTCIQCEYNLRGQLPEGACPECGTPVTSSMRSDRLSQANPQWLRTLRRSTTWIMLGGVTIILLGCLSGFMPVAFGMVPSIIVSVISLAQAMLFCIGYWMLTEPEPGVLRPRISRPITRWIIVPGFALSIPSTLLLYTNEFTLLMISSWVKLASSFIIICGFCTSLIYMRHLARRIPHVGLAKQTTIVFWGSLSTILAVVPAVTLLIIFGDDIALGGQAELALLVVCPIALAVLTFFVWWLILISAYSRSFDRAVKASRNRIRATRRSAVQPG